MIIVKTQVSCAQVIEILFFDNQCIVIFVHEFIKFALKSIQFNFLFHSHKIRTIRY